MVLCDSMNAGTVVVDTREVVVTLKPYPIQKNLFKLFTLRGSRRHQKLRVRSSSHPSHLVKFSHPNLTKVNGWDFPKMKDLMINLGGLFHTGVF